MSIYKKASDNVKTFDNGEEFLKYYEKNKETIDEIPTRGLNLKYKIKGFKIGRRDNKIILWPTKELDSKDEIINELLDRVSELESQVKKIITVLNQVQTSVPKQNYNSNRENSWNNY